jgi:histone H3/H4
MDEFTKTSITRLSKRAGIKVMSEECYDSIRNLIGIQVDKIIKDTLIVNEIRGTKTLMVEDLIDSLSLKGIYISKSTDLNLHNVSK